LEIPRVTIRQHVSEYRHCKNEIERLIRVGKDELAGLTSPVGGVFPIVEVRPRELKTRIPDVIAAPLDMRQGGIEPVVCASLPQKSLGERNRHPPTPATDVQDSVIWLQAGRDEVA